MATAVSNDLRVAEARVQAHSKALRRELGIGSLVLAQILMVVVPEFFATAVKAGYSHVVLWLLAMILFYVPHALVVAHLSRLMPLEGGLYEWARIAFNDRVGFLVGWNIWINTTLQVSQIALITMTYFSYAESAQLAWFASNRWILFAASIALIGLMIFVARAGLGVGKWISTVGSVFTVAIIGVLALIPFFQAWRGTLPTYHPLRLVAPAATLFTLSVFCKMTFGALSGFEMLAIFGGETRHPGRNFSRSILYSAPIIALLYVLGTSSILAYVSPEAVDFIGPIPQALSLSLHAFSLARILVPGAILLLLANYLCSYTMFFSSNARLPMVAGWENVLPSWFTRLHEKHRTPVNSIYFMGGLALVASTVALVGVGHEEAFALLQIWTWGFYALAYLGMFAIPLFARKSTGIRPGLWLRVAAVSGFLVTLLFVLLAVLPVVEVQDRFAYSIKVVGVLIGCNILGLLLYQWGTRRRTNAST